jgi:hypothetical protein
VSFLEWGVTKQCDKTEEKEVLPTYFERRKNGIIYVRLEMPGALKKITPKDEHRVRLSMDTYNAEQALIRGTPLIHSIKAKWAALRKKHAKLLLDVSRPKARSWSAPNIVDGKGSTEPAVLTQDLIDELIASRIRTWVFTDDFERYQYGLDDDEFKECSFAGRIDPLRLTLPPGPRERGDPVVRPLEPQFF